MSARGIALAGVAIGGAALGAVVGALIAHEYYTRRQKHLDIREALHKLHPGLLARESTKGKPRRKSSAFIGGTGFTRVVRVVLTGGPCGGKSSSLANIIRVATDHGYDVYACPESATIMFNGGMTFPSARADQINFQAQLFRIQLAAERAFTSIAERTGRPTILLMDRGLMDGKGYVESAEMWSAILEKNSVDEDYILGRYDAVVHLVTAADGAERFYQQGRVKDDLGNEVIRHESSEEAVSLDRRMRDVWAAHPEQHVIGNDFPCFKAKTRAATDTVMRLARKLQPVGSPIKASKRSSSDSIVDSIPEVPANGNE